MIVYYDFQDNPITNQDGTPVKYSSVPNRSFYPYEKYYIDEDTKEQVDNTENFDQTAAEEDYLNKNVRITKAKVLEISDIFDAESYLDRLSAADKTAFKDWRNEWRDLTDTVRTANFTGWSFPTTPSFLPQNEQTQINDLIGA